jgi:RNA polymerase sigma factor (sigma-70 family)
MSSSVLSTGLRQLRHQLAAPERREDSDDQLLQAFTSRRDDNAFAALVHRHGPMVLRVCRRLLGQEQDAEDAFQATFLVLARNAASLRNKGSLASFLHGIAYRLARDAKRSAARRRKHERCSSSRSPVDPADELSWREVQTLLDEEIASLPEIYRSAFILCCLENLGRAEAAQRLGLEECTLRSRLAKARKRLSERLARRGVELTAVLAVSAVATPSVSALPAGLMAKTMSAVVAIASGKELAGMISVSVAELVHDSTVAMIGSKAKIAIALTLTMSMLAGFSAWAYRSLTLNAHPLVVQPVESAAAKVDDKPKIAPSKPEAAKTVEIQGCVVDPDGKPVRGAKLLFLFNLNPHFYFHYDKKFPKKIWATSGAEGRFRFTVPAEPLDDSSLGSPWEVTYVLAAADGYGIAVTQLGKPGATDLTLRLVPDTMPIRGRILNLEGKPVAGARVRIADALYLPKKDDLTTWLAALKTSTEDPAQVDWTHLTELHSSAFDLLIPPVTTGKDGRFQIKGIGRERLARLRIEGATIATQIVKVQTHSEEAIRVQRPAVPKPRTLTYTGAALDILAAPSRAVAGVVRDKDTRKPLAGITVETAIGDGEFIRSTTDKDGRYRLDGLTKSGGGYELMVMTKDMPYLPARRNVEVDAMPGLEAVTIDIALKRGVWVKGRVFDKATGKPQWANVEYHCFADNPDANEVRSLQPYQRIQVTQKDGSFRIVALPGRGVIAVLGIGEDSDAYIMGTGADKIKGLSNPLALVPGDLCLIINQHTLAEINPKAGDESITCDAALDPGRTLAGKIFGPDGKPLAGARVSGLNDGVHWEPEPLPGADFTVKGIEPNKPRLLQFVHEGKKLAGLLRLRGDEKGLLQVRLEQRWGTLTGRVFTPDAKPMAGARVACYLSEEKHHGEFQYIPLQFVLPFVTDNEGRFCIEGLIPGLKHELHFFKPLFYDLDIVGGRPKDLMFEPGEPKDLGGLRVKPRE